jgi:hypothetical protein
VRLELHLAEAPAFDQVSLLRCTGPQALKVLTCMAESREAGTRYREVLRRTEFCGALLGIFVRQAARLGVP